MTITRASAEAILVRRCGALLVAAGLDGTTVNGTNADLNDPIGVGLRKLGYTTADPADVSDADLATLDAGDLDAFLDVANHRALLSILGNLDEVNIAVGPRREDLGALAKTVKDQADVLATKIADEYGIGGGELSTGLIDLNFSERGDDLSDL